MKLPCPPCLLEYHNECSNRVVDDSSTRCCCNSSSEKPILTQNVGVKGPGNRTYKDDESVTDPKSTGRKRAKELYPITPGDICEWAGLKFAGGGKHPIIGCLGSTERNTQSDRHHGPDKNTLNNSNGNVHRICDYCHNRWHAANDANYDPQSPEHRLHDGNTRASLEEMLANEAKYAGVKLTKVTD